MDLSGVAERNESDEVDISELIHGEKRTLACNAQEIDFCQNIDVSPCTRRMDFPAAKVPINRCIRGSPEPVRKAGRLARRNPEAHVVERSSPST